MVVAETDVEGPEATGTALPKVVEIAGLSLTFQTADGPVFALSDIDLTVGGFPPGMHEWGNGTSTTSPTPRR